MPQRELASAHFGKTSGSVTRGPSYPIVRPSPFLKLVPIAVAAHLWGSSWYRLQVLFLCDNQSIVDILNTGTSRQFDIMHLLRCLTRVACSHNFSFRAQHTPGRSNGVADALSRFCLQEFHRLAPNAHPLPRVIPPTILNQLVPPASSTIATTS